MRAVLLALVLLALPATAQASVRNASVQDPCGDAVSLSGPAVDLRSIAIRHDDGAGGLSITWTYCDDLRPYIAGPGGINGQVGIMAPTGIDYATITWSAAGGGLASANLSVSGADGSLAVTPALSPDGTVVSAEFANAALIGRPWLQSLGMPSGADPFAGFWFDGYGPSTTTPPVSGPAPSPGPVSDNVNAGMTINGGAQFTNDPDVTLSVVAPAHSNTLRVANDGGFREARTFAAASTISWRLAESGAERLPKTVYLRFGTSVQTFTDDIILDQTRPLITSATLVAGGADASAAARSFRIRVRAKDATSGVAKVQFTDAGKRRVSKPQAFATSLRYRAAAAPRYARVQDRAGNFSRWQRLGSAAAR